MKNKIVFKKIQKGNIFREEFFELKENNEIVFKQKLGNGVAVVYGANGTGKTSLAEVLSNDKKSKDISFEIEYNRQPYTEKDENLFYIIRDKDGRNVIPGSSRDYLIGQNIQREIDLRNEIDTEFVNLFKNNLHEKLKNEFNIKKKTSKLIYIIKKEKLQGYIEKLANNRSKGDTIDKADFISTVQDLKEIEIEVYEEDKFDFLINNYTEETSVLYKLMNIESKNIIKQERVTEIEENDIAIRVLNKYLDRKDCIVCDTEDIDAKSLIEKKDLNKKQIINTLDKNTKKIFEEIISHFDDIYQDPFQIKENLLNCIKEGDKDILIELQEKIIKYIELFNNKINNLFLENLNESSIIRKMEEYHKILKNPVEITDEDMAYLAEFIKDSIDKELEIKRDQNDVLNKSKLRILLDDNEILGESRTGLHLSTGEQNFISLAFELLLAQKKEHKIIVLDDPISSFDSIYKNKIAYCLLKFLKGKNQLILTHNSDLLKVLEAQAQSCFNFYLLGNSDGGVNGFIKVKGNEKEIFLKMDKLLELLRGPIIKKIKQGQEKRFLVSMIPFMRGYANIIGNKDIYSKLSKVMHGYEEDSVDVGECYKELFLKKEQNKEENENLFGTSEDYTMKAEDILGEEIEGSFDILDKKEYGLLNRTLYHSYTYLYLRLKVEHNLVKNCNIKKQDIGKRAPLQEIILLAFKEEENDSNEVKAEKRRKRVFFTSKKTLLNEFNHFEGNMNLFQPAIDISDSALDMEKQAILKKLNELVKV